MKRLKANVKCVRERGLQRGRENRRERKRSSRVKAGRAEEDTKKKKEHRRTEDDVIQ